ncbi:MAG: hypothetical protein J5659_06270 [Clostridia bacterium]|nr:hypothetical protein [Clostridia bacterium]
MKDIKQSVCRVFAIISFLISVVLFGYVITIAVSFFSNITTLNSVGASATDYLFLSLIEGAVSGLVSLIGCGFLLYLRSYSVQNR